MLDSNTLITYIKKEHNDFMSKIDTDEESVLKAYEEYDEFVKEVLDAKLSAINILKCFRAMEDLYAIKTLTTGALFYKEIDEIEHFDPRTKKGMRSGINKAKYSVKIYFQKKAYSEINVCNYNYAWNPLLETEINEDEKLLILDELDYIEKNKDSKPSKSILLLKKKERIILLESIIGKQKEFKKIWDGSLIPW